MARSGPDPLEISPVNPVDFRCVDGKWVYVPGWWRSIPTQRKSQEANNDTRRVVRKGGENNR